MYIKLIKKYIYEIKIKLIKMYIRKITIYGIYAFYNFSIELDSHINIIVGNNDTSKTALYIILNNFKL